MDTFSIKVQHGHPDTKLGRIIRQLCNEIERLKRKERIQNHLMTQVVQLNRRERRKQARRQAA